MNKKQIEKNLKEIIELYNNLQSSLHDLLKWVKNDWPEREHLDEFLDYVWIEKNEETRFAAYSRISTLHENALELYLEKNDFSKKDKRKVLDKSYDFVCDFHSEIQAVLISVIENKKLVTPFYLEIFKWVANVWLAFNELFLPWRNHIVNWINKDLEDKFDNDSDKIVNFLNENNLFDLGHNWITADRSYSALVLKDWKYTSKAYVEVFEKEVKNIVEQLDIFINNLSQLEDEIYDSKQNYIDYLNAIKNALLEKNTNNLIEKWSKVDDVRMEIKTPFQISHPLEYYEDKYRKAVAPEWDLRILNTVFKSDIEESMEKMYEELYDDIWREKYKSSYEFSLSSQKRVQLYLTSPVLYYSSELTWLYSAQVVPNDEKISKVKWKKIFAFPEMVLESKRREPFMKIQSVTLEKDLLYKYRKSLFWENSIFYKIYDIETLWHEYGHTLWLDSDTETVMNRETGVYKKIEEFKATAGGLVMYFLNEKLASKLQEELIIHHSIRCIWLLKYREVNEIEPYYCEALIHLDILFESEIIKKQPHPNPLLIGEGTKGKYQIKLNFSEENYKKLKEVYIKHYKKLINIYLEKIDAWKFLSDYTVKNKEWYYLPKDKKIREFVEYYYGVYKEIGNEIDGSVTKEDYI